jgi:septum site-determining protein MinC
MSETPTHAGAAAVAGAAHGEPVPLTFKGSSITLTTAHLHTTDLAVLATTLTAKAAQAPAFFEDAPVVVDLSEVELRPLDLPGLVKVLRGHGLIPVGVRGGSERQLSAAHAVGLPLFRPGRPTRPEPEPEPAAEPETSPTRLVTQPVRSGQQIYARGGDLVVLGAVNPGAEILADGNIHVYAPLRGRALAGVQGDAQARIYTLCLEAELLAIGGTYRVIEDDLALDVRGKPAQIYLDGESLKIQALG